MLYPPVRPFEEDLRNQVIRGGVTMLTNDAIRLPFLSSTVDVESSERDSQALRELSTLIDR